MLEDVLNKLKRADLPVFEGVALDHANTRGLSFGDTPLHIVAIWGDVDSLKTLISSGAIIDAKGEEDYTPLHEAIEQSHIEVAVLLLEAGANPYLCCHNGDAFELAEKRGRVEIALVLNKYK